MKTDPLTDLTLLTRRILQTLTRLSAAGELQGEHRISANGKTVYIYIDDMTLNLEQLDEDEAGLSVGVKVIQE